jgi:hypothetical protein
MRQEGKKGERVGRQNGPFARRLQLQWSIVNADTLYQISYTMASYWSAHMWTWLVKRRPIWFDVHEAPTV